MDPTFDPQARRLFVSTALSTQVLRYLHGRVPADSNAQTLLVLARRLGEEANNIERRYQLHFEPPYPGVTAGPESIGDAFRLVLACIVSDKEGTPFGVVFTTLSASRTPQVSVAPAEAWIPENWRPLSELS